MLKMTIDNEEVLSNNDISIKEEILSPSSTILNNVYPKSWEQDKDYVSRFYYPKDYSKLNIQNFSVEPEEAGTTIDINGSATLNDVDTTKESRVLSLKGQTSQTTYTGKNLSKLSDKASTTTNTLTYSASNQVGIFSGTTNANTTATLSFDTFTLSAGTYSFCLFRDTTSRIDISLRKAGTNELVSVTNFGNVFQNKISVRTFTLTEEISFQNMTIWIPSGTATNDHLKFMIVSGSYTTSNIGEYEPYVGGTTSPNPSYPQNVNVVSGDNEIKINGKNLYNGVVESVRTYHNDMTTTTSSITTTSTSNYAYRVVAIQIPSSLVNTQCTLSFKGKTSYTSSTMRNRISLTNENSADTSYYGYKAITTTETQYSISFTPEATTIYLSLYSNLADTTITTLYAKDIQIEKGSTATTYEPYIGSSYPIQLGVENLFNIYINKSSGYTRTLNGITEKYNDDGSITYTGTATAQTDFYITDNGYPSTDTIITLDTSKKYTLSLTGNTGTNIRWSVGYGTTAYHCNTTYTFTPTTNISWSFIRISNGATVNATIYPQLEIGTKANHFTPYGTTPIELCKIGTYQDYIYKDNGSWYVHKEVGKVVLNGSESWERYGLYAGYYLFYVDGISPAGKSNTTTYDIGSGFCNYFLWSTYQLGNEQNEYCRFQAGNGTRFYVGQATDATLANFKTWLSSNNLIVYYVLATPTNTLIEDTTLISQLESLSS